MKTPLVCTAFPPGTPNNPTDVLDLTFTKETIRLTIRRDGKVSLNLKWNNDENGRECAEVMMEDMTRHSFRAPTDEELRTVPDLMSSVHDAEPADTKLCIQWDTDGRSLEAAVDPRNEATEWVERLLDNADLVIEWEGASIGDGTCKTTFAVSDYAAAGALLWKDMPNKFRAHNCRIFNEGAGEA